MTGQGVQEAMERAIAMGEVGLQVAAYLEGELLVDACAGRVWAEGPPVTPETLFAVFSVTKAVTATALHLQAERGLISYSSRVSDYWPGYGRHGKEATTVSDVLCHRAGIPQMPAGVTPELMCDWDWMIDQIEAFEPIFPPGTVNAYHELVWGWLVGELVRRTDPGRRPLSDFIRNEICAPLAIQDVYLGLPPSAAHRVAPVICDAAPVPTGNPLFDIAMPRPVFPGPAVHNLPVVRAGVHPGAGVIMTARSGARLFALLAGEGELDGVRLLSPDRIRGFARPRPAANEVDRVMGRVTWMGSGGYWLGGPAPPAYPVLRGNPRVLGHPGIGGSIAWADPDRRLSVAICHNWMQPPHMQESYDPEANPFIGIADAIRSLADAA